jgi:predicted nucleotidyltransferase component of viral defense system
MEQPYAKWQNAGFETSMNNEYTQNAGLLLEIAPHVFASGRFALKGGTALNFFVQEMPRLSVDIDVVHVDHTMGREAALAEIGERLAAIQGKLERLGYDVRLISTKGGDEVKLLVSNGSSQVKIEVNHVFRGSLLPVERAQLTPGTRDYFKVDCSVPMLAIPELYGGKLVAAMDRQHPRDLFDVLGMYRRFGLTESIVECFVSYLAGHHRPIHEVLFSQDSDMSHAFDKEFSGMTNIAVSLAELEQTRARLRRELPEALSDKHRRFLISLANAEPKWDLMACPHLEQLPAIRWKLLNLAKLKKTNPEKFHQQSDELRRRFDS